VTGRPPLLTLFASLTMHSAALGGLFVLGSGEPISSALVVDLEEPGKAADEGASARPTRRAASNAAPPRSAPARSPVDAAPAPVSPPAAPSLEVAPEREVATSKPPEVRQPDPVVTPSREEPASGPPPRLAGVAPGDVGAAPGDANAAQAGQASDRSSARRATEGSSTAAGESPVGNGASVALAPVGPRGGDIGSDYGPYYKQIRQRIQESLQYPPAARRRGIKGTVLLEILIDPNGAISAVSVVVSSTHPLLDDAALETVRGLGRQPFPAGLPRRPLTMRQPVVFDLR